MAFPALPLAVVFPSLHQSAHMICHPIKSGQMATRKTLKNGNTLILYVCPYLAIHSKITFPKVHFQHILWVVAGFHNWLQNCRFLGGTWLSETIRQVKCLFEFGCNSIVRGGLFLPRLSNIPACLYAGIRTNTPATIQGVEWRCIYLDGTSKECVHVRMSVHACVYRRVCACARALCDKGHREVHLLSLISQ